MKAAVRPQFKFRLEPELDVAVRRYCAAHNLALTALMHAALREYMSRTSPHETLMRRLDRVSRQLEQQQRAVQLLSEALGAFVQLWLGHTPEVHPENHESAWRSTQARYRKWVDYVAHRLSGADSFLLQFAATPVADPAELDAARAGGHALPTAADGA